MKKITIIELIRKDGREPGGKFPSAFDAFVDQIIDSICKAYAVPRKLLFRSSI